eukprot:tig00000459_g1099.t1
MLAAGLPLPKITAKQRWRRAIRVVLEHKDRRGGALEPAASAGSAASAGGPSKRPGLSFAPGQLAEAAAKSGEEAALGRNKSFQSVRSFKNKGGTTARETAGGSMTARSIAGGGGALTARGSAAARSAGAATWRGPAPRADDGGGNSDDDSSDAPTGPALRRSATSASLRSGSVRLRAPGGLGALTATAPAPAPASALSDADERLHRPSLSDLRGASRSTRRTLSVAVHDRPTSSEGEGPPPSKPRSGELRAAPPLSRSMRRGVGTLVIAPSASSSSSPSLGGAGEAAGGGGGSPSGGGEGASALLTRRVLAPSPRPGTSAAAPVLSDFEAAAGGHGQLQSGGSLRRLRAPQPASAAALPVAGERHAAPVSPRRGLSLQTAYPEHLQPLIDDDEALARGLALSLLSTSSPSGGRTSPLLPPRSGTPSSSGSGVSRQPQAYPSPAAPPSGVPLPYAAAPAPGQSPLSFPPRSDTPSSGGTPPQRRDGNPESRSPPGAQQAPASVPPDQPLPRSESGLRPRGRPVPPLASGGSFRPSVPPASSVPPSVAPPLPPAAPSRSSNPPSLPASPSLAPQPAPQTLPPLSALPPLPQLLPLPNPARPATPVSYSHPQQAGLQYAQSTSYPPQGGFQYPFSTSYPAQAGLQYPPSSGYPVGLSPFQYGAPTAFQYPLQPQPGPPSFPFGIGGLYASSPWGHSLPPLQLSSPTQYPYSLGYAPQLQPLGPPVPYGSSSSSAAQSPQIQPLGPPLPYGTSAAPPPAPFQDPLGAGALQAWSQLPPQTAGASGPALSKQHSAVLEPARASVSRSGLTKVDPDRGVGRIERIKAAARDEYAVKWSEAQGGGAPFLV